MRRSTLPGGARVVTAERPSSRSAAVGLWFGSGSRDEEHGQEGATHLLEHLLFRSGAARTGPELARAVDLTGGELDATTSREHTLFHARVPAASLGAVLACMAEVALHPTFDAHDLDAERRVVLEELRAADDDPGDVADRQLLEALFPGHALGREIIGTRESLARLDATGLRAHHRRFTADRMVVSAAGAVDHDRLCEWVAGLAVPAGGERVERVEPPSAAPGRLVASRPTEQAHVEIGLRARPHGHPDRHALAVANHLLGGGPSSRLFLDVRDRRGLAYDVWSAVTSYSDAGTWTAGASVAPEAARTVERLLIDHLRRLAADGPTDEEVVVARSYLIGSTDLALDDHGALSGWLGFGEMYLGGARPVDGDLEALAGVTPADVARVVADVLAAADPVVSVVSSRE